MAKNKKRSSKTHRPAAPTPVGSRLTDPVFLGALVTASASIAGPQLARQPTPPPPPPAPNVTIQISTQRGQTRESAPDKRTRRSTHSHSARAQHTVKQEELTPTDAIIEEKIRELWGPQRPPFALVPRLRQTVATELARTGQLTDTAAGWLHISPTRASEARVTMYTGPASPAHRQAYVVLGQQASAEDVSPTDAAVYLLKGQLMSMTPEQLADIARRKLPSETEQKADRSGLSDQIVEALIAEAAAEGRTPHLPSPDA